MTSIILAGGLSTRMGQDKALLKIAGQPLLQRVIDVAQRVSSPVLVVTAWPEKYQAIVGCEFLGDQFTQGPIVAFAQGLAQVNTEWVLLLSCDLPNLRSDLLQTWIDQLATLPKNAIAYLPSGSKGWEPLCGFYRSTCRESVQEYVNNGGRSLQHWLQTQVVETLVVEDRSVLFNCNTPEDLKLVMNPFLLVTDLDNTLVGNEPALRQLNELLARHRQTGSKLIYATGRSHRLYKTLASQANLLKPDILITSVGAEIYQDGINLDRTWANHLAQAWHAGTVRQVTQQFSQLIPQPDSEQCPTKVSCFLAPADSGILPELKLRLEAQNIRAQVIYSSDRDLDILPQRADKGKALTYVRELLGFAPDRTVACGDSGNDIALFTENTRGIIVGNARSELMRWHEAHPSPDRYLAQADCAAGILEGLRHFDFIAAKF